MHLNLTNSLDELNDFHADLKEDVDEHSLHFAKLGETGYLSLVCPSSYFFSFLN